MGSTLEAILKKTKYYHLESLDEPKAKEIAESVNFCARDRNETALLIAFLIVESDGFVCTEYERTCSFWAPYNGRGYFKLRGGANYRQASQELHGDDRLVKNPDLVTTGATPVDVTNCIVPSMWIWRKRVQPLLDRSPTATFYTIMRALNGEGDKDSAYLKERYDVYVIAAKQLGVVGLTPMQ